MSDLPDRLRADRDYCLAVGNGVDHPIIEAADHIEVLEARYERKQAALVEANDEWERWEDIADQFAAAVEALDGYQPGALMQCAEALDAYRAAKSSTPTPKEER